METITVKITEAEAQTVIAILDQYCEGHEADGYGVYDNEDANYAHGVIRAIVQAIKN